MKILPIKNIDLVILPKWLNNKFIRSHRSNLLRKNYEHYKQFKWNVPLDLEYVWPTKNGG